MNRLILVGGFLGAGKTTALLGMAQVYLQKGLRVGLVTNDQGSQLVDTDFLAAHGLPVYDVKGGCFCCHFDELVEKLNALNKAYWPDILLTEPVGSCTDLVATIFKPMQAMHAQQFMLSPLTVMVDPLRLSRFIEHTQRGSLTDMDYLFQKQLEEADVLFLNKCDLLEETQREALLGWLRVHYPASEKQWGSAAQNQGLDELCAALEGAQFAPKPSLNIDYQAYAEAEARLGWCNATFSISGVVDPGRFAQDFFELCRNGVPTDADLAHLKAIFTGPDGFFKVGLTQHNGQVQGIDNPSIGNQPINAVVNARVTMPPAVLLMLVKKSADGAAEDQGAHIENFRGDSFAPGAPNPPYRM